MLSRRTAAALALGNLIVMVERRSPLSTGLLRDMRADLADLMDCTPTDNAAAARHWNRRGYRR